MIPVNIGIAFFGASAAVSRDNLSSLSVLHPVSRRTWWERYERATCREGGDLDLWGPMDESSTCHILNNVMI